MPPPPCNTHTHDTHHLFNCTHIRTTLSPLNLWTYPAGVTVLLARWTEKLAGGPKAGTSDTPTSKGHGSGYTTTVTTQHVSLQQQNGNIKYIKYKYLM